MSGIVCRYRHMALEVLKTEISGCFLLDQLDGKLIQDPLNMEYKNGRQREAREITAAETKSQ